MDNETQCVYNLISQSIDKCLYVQENCNNQSKIAFTKHFYCIANENYLFLMLLIPITLYIIFHSLQRTAELYLSPGITKIANYFQMSQTLAGVTIIAFANGAPDMITAFVAINETNNGLLIAIGSIFGSGFIMTTIIIGAIQYYSKNSQINRASLIRDLIYNLIGISIIIYFGYKGSIEQKETFIYVLIYLSYIIFVFLNKYADDKQFQQTIKNNQKILILEECQGLLNDNEQTIENECQQIQEQPKIYAYFENKEEAELFDEQLANHSLNVSIDDINEKELKFKDLSFLEKLEKIITFIFDFIIDHSILLSNNKENHFKCSFWLNIFISPFILIYLLELQDIYILNIPFWFITLIFSILIGIINQQQQINENGQTKLEDLLSYLSLFQSIIWCKFFVEILIDLIILIQTLTGLSHSFLGMTFLAVGNSACDFFVNTELAKKGLGIMATTGCYSGAFFNANIGLGLALMYKCTSGSIPFDLFFDTDQIGISPQTRLVVLILLIALFINLFITLIMVLIKKFKLKRNQSYYYFLYYIIVLCIITMITFGFFRV